jgi:hypothetical protein
MRNGECLWHAGKVLGGGSAINGMLYVRGDRYNILPKPKAVYLRIIENEPQDIRVKVSY